MEGGGAKYQVSTEGGRFPEWSADGREIYYIGLDRRVNVVEVERAEDWSFGLPRELFDGDHAVDDVILFQGMPDGERFVLQRFTEAEQLPQLTLIQNWTRLLDEP